MPVSDELQPIRDKVLSGERLSYDDGLLLFRTKDLNGLGLLSNHVREKRHGNHAYYNLNCHINYSNFCLEDCIFCAFGKKPGQKGAYEMSIREIEARAENAVRNGATEVHMVGGLHPTLPYDFYPEMVRRIHETFPELHIKAFTAVEIDYFANLASKSMKEVLTDLIDAGLGSLPGGGAEIFAERIRSRICGHKTDAQKWIDCHRDAHALGLRSNATMLYGHLENDEDRVDHMVRLRELQDETKGFMTFIPLSFHPANTPLQHLPGPTGNLDIRCLAISRLLLDNFDHIKVFWIMSGIPVSEMSLWYGANDVDGTVVDERITHMAGATTPIGVTEEALKRWVLQAGRTPVRRDTLYENLVPA